MAQNEEIKHISFWFLENNHSTSNDHSVELYTSANKALPRCIYQNRDLQSYTSPRLHCVLALAFPKVLSFIWISPKHAVALYVLHIHPYLTQRTTPQLQGSSFSFMYSRLYILKYRKAHILLLSKQELWHKWKQVHRNNEKKTQ